MIIPLNVLNPIVTYKLDVCLVQDGFSVTMEFDFTFVTMAEPHKHVGCQLHYVQVLTSEPSRENVTLLMNW